MRRESTDALMLVFGLRPETSVELQLELQKAANQDLQRTNVAIRKERDKARALNETLLDALALCSTQEPDRFLRSEILGLADN